jgi:hypothetical protein
MISTIANALRSTVSYILSPSTLALKLATGSKKSEPSTALKVILSRLTLLVCLLLLIFVDVDPPTKEIITDVIRNELNTHTDDSTSQFQDNELNTSAQPSTLDDADFDDN